MKKRKFAKTRKAAIAALCAIAVTCTGIAAACAHTTADEEKNNETQTPVKEDTQLLKNGNFEFFGTIPEDAVYLIKNVSNWSRSGDTSGTMSGIIDTSETAWGKISDYDLKNKLDINEDLTSDNPDYEDLYVDYNGMKSKDIPYIEPYAASSLSESNIGDDADGYAKDSVILGGGKQKQRSYKEFLGIEDGEEEGAYTFRGEAVYLNEDDGDYYFDTDYTKPVRYAVINNPETHLGSYSEAEGKHYLGGQEILVDEDGSYWIDTDGDGAIDREADESTGNVLMVHNYSGNKAYNGIEQHYSSQTITLEANTAAKISLWVKTSDLKFDKGYLQNNDQDRGAYIEVTQRVASSTIDSFKIKAINTEKILADNPDLGSNGWLQYTIFVNACDFASSSVTINLGLGDTDTENKVTGYAFFDDVKVEKMLDLADDADYNSVKDEISAKSTSCSLTSEGEKKVFVADKQIRGVQDDRYSTSFNYLIDLASETYGEASSKQSVSFTDGAVTTNAALTTQESRNKTYAFAAENLASIYGFGTNDKGTTYELPSDLKAPKPASGIKTFNDLVGIYGSAKTSFTASDFNSSDSQNGIAFRDLSARLNKGIFGENGDMGITALSDFATVEDMIVILSAYGAAYTTTVSNASPTAALADTTTNYLGVNGTNGGDNHYKIISFWVKTMDMNGKTAATIRLVDAEDEDNVASFTIDSTGITTDIGEDNENIYSDWVQCFFFVDNETETAKDFKLEFQFGATSVTNATATSYNYGWAAMTNFTVLDVNEDVFSLVSEGNYAKKLTFTDEETATDDVFDNPNVMSDVNTGVATPSTYYGVNGGSSYVSDKVFGDDYDMTNNNKGALSGLINRDKFDDYAPEVKDAILGAFGATDYAGAFGNSYQPLIIVDELRTYRDRAKVTAETFEELKAHLYIREESGEYTPVAADAEYDQNTTYYGEEVQVKNYGYIGPSQSVSANSYSTVSVNVKVAGNAVAYIYLVDTDTDEVLEFATPSYTFYYDVDGNVLSKEYDEDWTDKEREEAIVYKLRDDGLYEDKNGEIYANLHNLTSRYSYSKYQHNDFYNEKGEKVRFENLKDGETYYSDKELTKKAEHYLVVNNQRIYEYSPDEDAYYYLVNGERGAKVKNFDVSYARYVKAETVPQYVFKVEDTQGEWKTVNFVIHTGNLAKNYRLELWSGERDKTGETDAVGGAVAFDHSYATISESDYANILSEYETAIKDIYRDLILGQSSENLSKLSDEMNIEDYETLIEELDLKAAAEEKLAQEGLAGYEKQYYTFTWYDSSRFVPFNVQTAEAGQTGYDYSITDNGETLVYFSLYDELYKSYYTFVDYSAVDQTVELSDSGNNNEDSGSDTPAQTNGNDNALLISSIVLVVVLLFALVAILVRGLWKKLSPKRKQKDLKKNNYKQRERYIRKLGLVKNEDVENESGEAVQDAQPEDVQEPAGSEETAEEASDAAEADETPEENTENKDE